MTLACVWTFEHIIQVNAHIRLLIFMQYRWDGSAFGYLNFMCLKNGLVEKRIPSSLLSQRPVSNNVFVASCPIRGFSQVIRRNRSGCLHGLADASFRISDSSGSAVECFQPYGSRLANDGV